jgi:hypothetical protein
VSMRRTASSGAVREAVEINGLSTNPAAGPTNV